MILPELLLIKSLLELHNYEHDDCKECENVTLGLQIINREINLKTMNVTKSKEDDTNMKMYGE